MSRAAHGAKRWRGSAGYAFASAVTALPLVGAEVAHAAADFPVVFTRTPSGYLPIALLGLGTRNLFVGPDGEWLAEYVPAALRSQPFALGRNEQGQLVLCIDESSPLVSDAAGEPFFDPAGELHATARSVGEFLSRIQQGRDATDAACKLLDRHGCIVPLEAPVKIAGVERRLEGLYQVGEAELNKVSGEALAELRSAGALAIAYAHRVSLHRLPVLVRREAVPAPPSATVDLSILDKDGTFGFDAFR